MEAKDHAMVWVKVEERMEALRDRAEGDMKDIFGVFSTFAGIVSEEYEEMEKN